MADEVLDDQGGEATESVVTDAAAEAAVGAKMGEIFGDHAEQAQRDENEESGVTSPDNPEGLDQVEPTATDKAEKADASNVDLADAGIDDLKAAEKEAAQAGDYERATQIRDQIKERVAEAAASQAKPRSDGFDPTLKSVAKDLGGWADKDINDFVKANPTLARITFENIAKSYNNVSLQYAQAARNGAPALAQPTQQTNATTQQQTATLESLYKDLDGFAQVAGSEVVDRFIKPLKSEVLEPLRDVIAFVNEQRAQTVRTQVNEGFAALAKDAFADHFGADAASLTQAQIAARQQVGQVADMIQAGAANQRVPMTYGEAIRRAHLIVNADKMQQQARKSIVKDAQRRSTQITSRPSNRIPRATVAGEQAAHQAVDDFWQNRD